jgi:hypothetical protein
MNIKKINKEQLVSLNISDEKLLDEYKFYPEKIVKIPFTNIVLSHTIAGWSIPNKCGLYFISSDEMEGYSVKNDTLYRKPFIHLTFSSGYRDDIRLYFDTLQEANQWVETTLGNIKLIEIKK